MRAWLYERLHTYSDLWPFLGGETGAADRVVPRQGAETINLPRPFLIYGLGHESNEDISEDPDFELGRQFFQVWIHDNGPTYLTVDAMIPVIKRRLNGVSHAPSDISQIRYLETSQEFTNETYNTVFRYLRFQAIISRQGVLTP